MAAITGPPTAVARVDGTERRVSGVCTHLGGIVRFNDAEKSWDCPCHGSRFDPHGRILNGPAVTPLEAKPLPFEQGETSQRAEAEAAGGDVEPPQR